MTYWIGLTGGIGSGKSAVAALFSKLGVPLIDADNISRSLTAENGAALIPIRNVFGNQMFDTTGRLNRTSLRTLVFNNPQAKKQLEALMFPLILDNIRLQQQQAAAVYGIIEIPQLIENPLFWPLVQRILVIDAEESIQIKRVISRSGLSEPEIIRIMANQASRRQRYKLADDVLANNTTLEILNNKVQRLHTYYQAIFSHSQQKTS